MLRRLEKGLNNAKLKSKAVEVSTAYSDSRMGAFSEPQSRLAVQDIPQYRSDLTSLRSTFNVQSDQAFQAHASGSSSMDEDDNDREQNEEGMYPAKLIKKERQRNSYFGTVLGPSGFTKTPDSAYQSMSPASADPSTCISEVPQTLILPSPGTNVSFDDPIKRGLMDEKTAENMMDCVLIRLNPFINLFDPELHSAKYVRNKCPFLFTTLLMAGSKFFDPQLYPKCRELADQHAVQAFAEARKSVEIVQAFMCLTYWKEPDDTVSVCIIIAGLLTDSGFFRGLGHI